MEEPKIEREMSFHEVAKILGTSNVKLLKFLRAKRILFVSNKRNMPRESYVDSGWFTVFYKDIENGNFHAVVPIVRITPKGLEKIEDLILPKPKFMKRYSDRTFEKAIRLLTVDRLKKLGIKTRNVKKWLSMNSIIHSTENGICTLFIFRDSEKVDIVKYNVRKKEILKNG